MRYYGIHGLKCDGASCSEWVGVGIARTALHASVVWKGWIYFLPPRFDASFDVADEFAVGVAILNGSGRDLRIVAVATDCEDGYVGGCDVMIALVVAIRRGRVNEAVEDWTWSGACAEVTDRNIDASLDVTKFVLRLATDVHENAAPPRRHPLKFEELCRCDPLARL